MNLLYCLRSIEEVVLRLPDLTGAVMTLKVININGSSAIFRYDNDLAGKFDDT